MNDSPNHQPEDVVPPVPPPSPPAWTPQEPVQPTATAQYPPAQHDPPTQQYSPEQQHHPPAGAQVSPPPSGGSKRGLWIALAAVGGVLVLGFITLVILVVVAFVTARHWTKVDVPAHPETFHTEQYETGNYDVANDGVDLCTVNQDWTDCINVLIDEYNGVCAAVPLTDDGKALCDDYLGEIDRMKGLDSPGYYVVTLGTYGTLTATPEVAERQVSNNDARPAKTHRATCYLGFIGECRGMPRPGETGSGTGSSA